MAASMVNVKASNTQKGRSVFATCNLNPGDQILSESAFSFALSGGQRRCDNCFSNSEILRCSKCKLQSYCNRSCQKSAWKVHKIECENLQRLSGRKPSGRKPSETVLLTSRLIHITQNDSESASIVGGFPSNLFDLQSNHEHLNDDMKNVFVQLVSILQGYHEEQLPSRQRLLHLFGLITCNSFNICDPEMQSIGVGIYLKASVFNHSCSPNCVAVFSGTSIHIRAVKQIKKGEECLISYIDLLSPSARRQATLQEHYQFTCDCERCQGRHMDGEMGSIICEQCSGQVLRKGDTDFDGCNDCGTTVSSDRLSNIIKLEEECKTYLNEFDSKSRKINCQQKDSSKEKRKILSILSKKVATTLHLEHVYRIRVVDMLSDGFINQQNWSDALNYTKMTVSPYTKIYPVFHPLLGVQLYRLGKLYHWVGSLTEAIKYLQQASDVIVMTHGKHHILYKQLDESRSHCIAEARYYSSSNAITAK